ncbi:MAG: AAA family ATPase [Planctomycetes bacterium]|nr:AAA family ATPase [Planctomycetota bacterium]
MAEDLARLVGDAACECVGWAGLRDRGHARVFAALVRGFGARTEVAILVEPSLVRSAERPPDLIVVDPGSGVHVIEVKGVRLDAIERVVGGEISIRYAGRARAKNPINRARTAMFDIKHQVERVLQHEVEVPFLWWVVFPEIERRAFSRRFELDLPELVFAEDVAEERLAQRMAGKGREWLARHAREELFPEELQAVRRAFGDSAVLAEAVPPPPGGREGSLGDLFHEIASRDRALSEEQQKLATSDWRGGPRLIRGVAGSGKTVVLAAHLARRLAGSVPEQGRLFTERGDRPERCLAVCFNRTLVPYIRQKIEAAYRQRKGAELPEGWVEVTHFNQLLHRLHHKGLWKYRPVAEDGEDPVAERAAGYLSDLEYSRQNSPGLVEEFLYDAIYVDEAQDLHPDEIRLLSRLCRPLAAGELAEIYLFYDDAQNLYGRPRPTWESLGVKLKGRSHVMVECHRNTRQIVEPALNVLLGATAPEGIRVQTRQFADTNYLEKERQVLERDGELWRVGFAARQGPWPQLHLAEDAEGEEIALLRRLRWLIEDEDVAPEDILVLGLRRERLRRLAGQLRGNLAVQDIRLPFETEQKDDPISRRGCLTLSTVNSAKGYDAFCVLLVSTNEFGPDRESRAAFYLACTRAREHLDVFAHEDSGLARELRLVLERLAAPGGSEG